MEIDAEALEVLKQKAKAHLRKQARAVRAAMSRTAIAERSQAIVGRLIDAPVLREAKNVALFFPIEGKNEVDLRELDKRLRERGVRIAYPALLPDEETPDGRPKPRTMAFRFVADAERMEERGAGFVEPSEDDPIAERLDAIVVPALSVDTRGHRIGYGAGFYDRTLRTYAPPARTVVVAFDFQLIAEVPANHRDVPCDWVVTDLRTIETRTVSDAADETPRSPDNAHVP
jgi:5-formyltetrahydrofolate cyclo-ligase